MPRHNLVAEAAKAFGDIDWDVPKLLVKGKKEKGAIRARHLRRLPCLCPYSCDSCFSWFKTSTGFLEHPKCSLQVATSLPDASSNTPHFGGHIHGIPAKVGVPAKVIAVGIDLSDLGYCLGAKVEGLFLEDAADDNDSFDSVFIADLPTTS